MTRRRRLAGRVRKTPQRLARKWRCRDGRRLRRELRKVQPWADPAYPHVARDIADNLGAPFAGHQPGEPR